MKEDVIGYRVAVQDENGLKELYQEDFLLADFADAKKRAQLVLDHMKKILPHDVAEIYVLVRKTVVIIEARLMERVS